MKPSLSGAAALCLLSLACGPRAPGPRPGETLFWRVISSEVALTACTDDPAFRSQTQPIAFADNTYLMYRVQADGRRATSLQCDRLDPATCRDHPTGIVFDIADHSLLYSTENKSPIGTEGCQLQAAQSWVLTDQGTSLSMEVTNVLSLVDQPTVCPRVEQQVKRQSPNGLGVEGCIVRYDVGATLD